MTVNNRSANIAAEGPHHSLRFYWAINGTATWHAETVGGARQHLLRADHDGQ